MEYRADWKLPCQLQLRARAFQLACHGASFDEKPLLRLTMHELRADLRAERVPRVDEEGEPVAPLPGEVGPDGFLLEESYTGRVDLALDGYYLNLKVNEMEPIVEPWRATLTLSKEPGDAGRVARIFSRHVLQLNLSVAFKRAYLQLVSMHDKSGRDAAENARAERTRMAEETFGAARWGHA